MTQNYQHFRIDESHADRVDIWMDVQGKSVNALSEPVLDELLQIVDEEARRGRLLPLVFRSAKLGSFVVGADLRRILAIHTDAEIQQFLLRGQVAYDRLEKSECVTVAVIHGPCLGGGLEFALACKYRLAVNAATTQLGMPEAKLGLIPGWGGTQRLIETIGVSEGLTMLLSGQSVDVHRAFELKLVDATVQEFTMEEELATFLRGLKGSQTGESMSNCGRRRRLDDSAAASELARCRLAYDGTLSKAQAAIFQAASIGITQSFESGLRAERDQFYELLMSDEVQGNLQRFANRSKPTA